MTYVWQSFFSNTDQLNVVRMLPCDSWRLWHFWRCVRVTTIVKTYGAHLKASAATVRLRLYDVLALLPPETYEGTVFWLRPYFQILKISIFDRHCSWMLHPRPKFHGNRTSHCWVVAKKDVLQYGVRPSVVLYLKILILLKSFLSSSLIRFNVPNFIVIESFFTAIWKSSC